jgi:hypothetical protein
MDRLPTLRRWLPNRWMAILPGQGLLGESFSVKGMRAPTTCYVSVNPVPLRGANYPSVVGFAAGEHGRGEGGLYHFWTAVLRRRVMLEGRMRWRVICRAQAVHPPGERFSRIGNEAKTEASPDDRKHNRCLWFDVLKRGRNIAYIRPSTLAEIKRWVTPHGADARHITHGIVSRRYASAKMMGVPE